MAKITSLTEEQLAQAPRYVEEWVAHGLNTAPADREVAEEGVRMAYRQVGLEPPTDMYWYDSPIEGVTAAASLIKHDKIGGPVSSSEILSVLSSGILGQNSVGWASFYAFVDEQLHLEGIEALNGLSIIAKSVGWCWVLDRAVVLVDRPNAIHRDDLFRLHNETGPAFSCRDGWALWFWHGVAVPQDLIEGPGWSVQRILGEENAEIRRCAIEKIGWDHFIDKAGLTQVSPPVDDPGNPGQTISLYDVPEQIYGTPVRVLLCTNATPERDGTRRRFGLTVDARVSTAVEAAAWTANLSAEQYMQMDRAT